MNEQTKKVLEWIVKNNQEYINVLKNKSYMEQDNVYTAEVCLFGVKQFLDNPDMINNI